MRLADRILQELLALPESKQSEVLSFVEFLHLKQGSEENRAWSAFSLSSAMLGMEDEQSPYTMGDLKESFWQHCQG